MVRYGPVRLCSVGFGKAGWAGIGVVCWGSGCARHGEAGRVGLCNLAYGVVLRGEAGLVRRGKTRLVGIGPGIFFYLTKGELK